MHYNYFRDYEPQTGRYVQSDPIGLIGGVSTYTYVWSSPYMDIDPYGLFNYFRGGLIALCEAYGITASLVNRRRNIDRRNYQLIFDVAWARKFRNCSLQRKHVIDMANYHIIMRGSFDQEFIEQRRNEIDNQCDEKQFKLYERLKRCDQGVGEDWIDPGGCEMLTLKPR